MCNVGLLTVEAEKCAEMRQDKDMAWGIRRSVLILEGVSVSGQCEPSVVLASAKSVEAKTMAVRGWHPLHFVAFTNRLLDILSGTCVKLRCGGPEVSLNCSRS